MRIEVAGGIAAGKSTFVHGLTSLFSNIKGVYEDFSSNTFLNDFYNDMTLYAYETEVSFLLQHMHQIKMAQREESLVICDFSIEQDYAYAISNLQKESQFSFNEIYLDVIRQVSNPQLIVFLDCPLGILKERIESRGRKNEQDINFQYLESSVSSLKERLDSISLESVVIDSSKYDFRKPEEMYHVFTNYLSSKIRA